MRPSPLLSSAARPLFGAVRVPGDKSISHRALMMGGVALGPTTISGLLEGEDVLATADAMRRLGALVEKRADGTYEVVGRGVGALAEPDDVLDMYRKCIPRGEAWRAEWDERFEAWDGDRKVFSKRWEKTIPRDLV